MRLFSALFGGFSVLFTAFGAAADSAGGFRPPIAATAQMAQAPGQLSLQERRQKARHTKIRKAAAQCRAVAKELASLKTRACAGGDRLDARTNICHPRKNVWMSYIRWDPAAGRCKPRDRFDGVSCVAGTRRYKPGRRFAHAPAQSARMYGQATARLQSELGECRQATSSLKNDAYTERTENARNCRQARKMNRADLVKFYCK